MGFNSAFKGLNNVITIQKLEISIQYKYEGWNFSSDNYLFTTYTK